MELAKQSSRRAQYLGMFRERGFSHRTKKRGFALDANDGLGRLVCFKLAASAFVVLGCIAFAFLRRLRTVAATHDRRASCYEL